MDNFMDSLMSRVDSLSQSSSTDSSSVEAEVKQPRQQRDNLSDMDFMVRERAALVQPPSPPPTQPFKPSHSSNVDMGELRRMISEELSRQGAGAAVEEFSQRYDRYEKEFKSELFQHVHRESVKCYRNTQAVIVENTNVIRQQIDDTAAGLRSMIIALIVLLVLNLGISALLMLHLIFGII